jgi:hypothetical protein
MSTSTRRRITLLDLLTLIAATAVGLALLRISIKGMQDWPTAVSAGALAASRIGAGQTYASCLLAPWSLALLALDLRGSRTSPRRAARGPGFIACAAATAGVALYLVACSIQFATGRLSLSPAAVSRITGVFDTYAALVVAGAWLSLVLDSRWRAETNWIGWAGRVVGIGWIGCHLLTWLRIAVF